MLATASNSSIITRDEDVSEFVIGKFKDHRLLKTGALLFKNIMLKMTTSIKKLSNNRAMQVAFCRFLSNQKTQLDEIEQNFADKTNNNCLHKSHVLCIQDTVEINYSSQKNRKSEFGINRKKSEQEDNQEIRGFLAHPGLVLNADNGDILGLSSVKVWTRQHDDQLTKERKKLSIDNKESYKWLETAQKAKTNLTNAQMLTIIGDRENDIFEFFNKIPDENTHIIVRSNYNRKLINNKFLQEHMDMVKNSGKYELDLPPITGIRGRRTASINIKHDIVKIKDPSNKNNYVELTCIEASEISTVNNDESPVFWRILTTHTINNLDDAKQILNWYSWRWNIEQIFRIMKKRGLKLESNELVGVDSLLKMFTLSIMAAINVLCLVNARDGKTDRSVNDLFTQEEIIFLTSLLLTLNGRTKKQKNPYNCKTLSWASWIIARLGGWNGYASERPPGPITMYDGLDEFYIMFKGWELAQKNVCTR